MLNFKQLIACQDKFRHNSLHNISFVLHLQRVQNTIEKDEKNIVGIVDDWDTTQCNVCSRKVYN